MCVVVYNNMYYKMPAQFPIYYNSHTEPYDCSCNTIQYRLFHNLPNSFNGLSKTAAHEWTLLLLLLLLPSAAAAATAAQHTVIPSYLATTWGTGTNTTNSILHCNVLILLISVGERGLSLGFGCCCSGVNSGHCNVLILLTSMGERGLLLGFDWCYFGFLPRRFQQ